MCWGDSTYCASLGKLGKTGEADGMQANDALASWGKCPKSASPLECFTLGVFQQFVSEAAA